ncbi:hypothetical protein CVN56_31255 [Rhodococcus sp. AQ5-07]|nr:hypothetical protein CVN56_31255 [Rhodococcus sp. AQ5-07]
MASSNLFDRRWLGGGCSNRSVVKCGTRTGEEAFVEGQVDHRIGSSAQASSQMQSASGTAVFAQSPIRAHSLVGVGFWL